MAPIDPISPAAARRLKDAVGMSDKDVEFLYGLAYSFFSHGRHGEAERVFSVVALCDPAQPRFWLGLGECRQKLGRYHDALAAYSRAFEPGCRDYRPALHIAECLFALRYLNATCVVLDVAESLLGDDAEHRVVAQHVATLRRSAEKARRDADKEQSAAQTLETATAC